MSSNNPIKNSLNSNAKLACYIPRETGQPHAAEGLMKLSGKPGISQADDQAELDCKDQKKVDLYREKENYLLP